MIDAPAPGWLRAGLLEARREAEADPSLLERVHAHPSGFIGDECVRTLESWPQWERDACSAILSPTRVDRGDDECSEVVITTPG